MLSILEDKTQGVARNRINEKEFITNGGYYFKIEGFTGFTEAILAASLTQTSSCKPISGVVHVNEIKRVTMAIQLVAEWVWSTFFLQRSYIRSYEALTLLLYKIQ